MSDNHTKNYWDFLNSLEKPVRDIIVNYSDEYVTGRWGDNWKPGIVESELWKLSREKGYGEFKRVMMLAFPNTMTDGRISEVFNMCTMGYNVACEEFARLAGVSTYG